LGKIDNGILVTSTLYRSMDDRAHAALRTAEEAATYGLTLLTVDEGSCMEFLDEFSARGAIFVDAEIRDMAACRRQAIREGAQRMGHAPHRAVQFIEPEKFSAPAQAARVMTPIWQGEAAFVNMNRISSKAYPSIQQATEAAANIMFNMILKQWLGDTWVDAFYGGRAVSADYASYFYQPDEPTLRLAGKWGATHLPMVRMIIEGLPIAVLPVDVEYSEDSRRIEEASLENAIKRWAQEDVLTRILVAYLIELRVGVGSKVGGFMDKWGL
jgi:hypothetical protein